MSEKDISRILKRKKVDLLVFSEDEKVLERVQQVSFQFRFVKENFKDTAEYIDQIYDFTRPQVILLEKLSDIAKLAPQVPHAALILLGEKSLAAEEMQECRAKGLAAALSFFEFYSTPKFEFLALQRIRAPYYPISLQDIFPSTEMSFNASVRLPLNQKYLPVIFKGFLLTEEKYNKIEREGRLFIRSQDAGEYLNYIKTYNDGLGVGLKKRCRALFLQLSYQILRLYENMTYDSALDQTEAISTLWSDLQVTLQEIAGYVRNAENVDLWEVFRDALVNEIFNHWRMPWHMVYAALTCQRVGKGDPLNAMLIAGLCSTGLMDIQPETFFDFVHKGEEALDERQQKELQKYPMLSLNRCLGAGLPLSEEVKSSLVLIHERQDGHGFPNQTPPENIPFEVWAVQYAQGVDLSVRTQHVDASVPFRFLRKVTWEKQVQPEGRFPEHIAKLLSLCHEDKSP